MREKEFIELFKSPEEAWDIADLICRTAKGLMSKKGLPRERIPAYEIVIKYLMGKGKIEWEIGEKLLSNLNDETITSIWRVRGVKKELVRVWTLERIEEYGDIER